MSETREPYQTFATEPCEPLFMVELIDPRGKSHGYIGYRFHAAGAQVACDGWNQHRDRGDLVAVIRPVEPVQIDAESACKDQDPRTLARKFEEFVNANSLENGSNTPDFILGKFLSDVLAAVDTLVAGRDVWYGAKHSPGSS